MMTIRMAQLSDAKALLELVRELATSFVIDPQAFDIALTELLSASSSYLAVAVSDRHKVGKVKPKGHIAAPEIVGYVLGFNHYTFYGSFAYQRRDLDLWIVFKPDYGWVAYNEITHELQGRSWDVLPQHQEDHPPAGIWVSKKGAKSYVYELKYY